MTITAIDGLPASPVMAAALARIAELGETSAARTRRIDTDAQVIALREERANLGVNHRYGFHGANQVFEGMFNGRIERMHDLGVAIRARIAEVDADAKAGA